MSEKCCTFAGHIGVLGKMNEPIHRILQSLLLIMALLSAVSISAQENRYKCELGLQGGLGYYVGDATEHIFNDVQWAAGAHFRYKFDYRWALQVKTQAQNLRIKNYGDNLLTSLDVLGEFNFFRFGGKQYDTRIKPMTPYIFLGVGAGLHSNFSKVGVYFPFGFGMKWKFAERCGLNVAWQHNLYFADNLEMVEHLDNTYAMNKANILKNDLTSSLTVGIVFEFAEVKKICKMCE